VSKKGFMLSIFTLLLNILTADCLRDTAKMKVVETITMHTLIVMISKSTHSKHSHQCHVRHRYILITVV